MRKTDHLVYCVPNLEEAMDSLSKKIGVPIVYGGKHPNHGTHNALTGLGDGAYLELLAIDPENTEIQGPKWMGLSLVDSPTLSRWALKSSDIKKDVTILNEFGKNDRKIITGSRRRSDGTLLRWEMLEPLPTPKISAIPFFVDWKDSPHPTTSLPNECKLVEIRVPDLKKIAPLFKTLKVGIPYKQSQNESFQAVIETPKGLVVL